MTKVLIINYYLREVSKLFMSLNLNERKERKGRKGRNGRRGETGRGRLTNYKEFTVWSQTLRSRNSQQKRFYLKVINNLCEMKELKKGKKCMMLIERYEHFDSFVTNSVAL